ncbi:hypothetical protein DIPPA_09836 [Diplonema papillatum]|nr:hypothetical protein DIPPA_09836 [Diplonema papillatum]
MPPAAALAVAMLAMLFAGSADAVNFTLTVADDTRRVMDLGTFGFAAGGIIEFRIEYINMKDRADEQLADPMGFTLDWVPTAVFARQEKNYGKGDQAVKKICFIEDPKLKPPAPMVKHWRSLFALEEHIKTGAAKNQTYIHRVEEPGMYALFFYNCKGYSDKSVKLQERPVSFRVHVSEYNLRDGEPDYLGVGDTNLPSMYLVFFFCFTIFSVAWIRFMRTHMQHVHKIHFLMAVLAILKTVSLFFEAMKYQSIQNSGAPSAWSYFSYAFLTLKGITLFLVILLLGTGWSILKPVLSQNDKHVALAILPLQILINIAIAVIEETNEGNRSWAYWKDILRLLDIACCCLVLFPFLVSCFQLQSVKVEGKAAKDLARLKPVRSFYIGSIAFLYVTRIFVVGLENYLPFGLTWVVPWTQEAVAVIFYAFAGHHFRPTDTNPLLYHDTSQHEDFESQPTVPLRHPDDKLHDIKPISVRVENVESKPS